MAGPPLEKPTFKGRIGLGIVGAIAVAFGVIAFTEGRPQVCRVVDAVPGASCGPADDPDLSALVVVGVLAAGYVALSVQRRRIVRRWRQDASGGEGRALSGWYWPVALGQGSLLILVVTMFLVLTAQVHDTGSETLPAWWVGLFGAFTLAFAGGSSSRFWRRMALRTSRRVVSRTLADAIAAGGGWCTFTATIGGLADGRPTLVAPLTGAPCVAWTVGAPGVDVVRTSIVERDHDRLDDEQRFNRKGRRTREEIVGTPVVPSGYSLGEAPGFERPKWKIQRTVEELVFHVVRCSPDPFTVLAEGVQLAVHPGRVRLESGGGDQRPLTRRDDPDLYAAARAASQLDEYDVVTVEVGTFQPGQTVNVAACVFTVDQRWYAGSVADAQPYLTHPVPVELHGELDATLRPAG